MFFLEELQEHIAEPTFFMSVAKRTGLLILCGLRPDSTHRCAGIVQLRCSLSFFSDELLEYIAYFFMSVARCID